MKYLVVGVRGCQHVLPSYVQYTVTSKTQSMAETVDFELQCSENV